LLRLRPRVTMKVISLQRRTRMLNVVMIVLLASVVFAMVFKPTL
jgi:hypothetical protein